MSLITSQFLLVQESVCYGSNSITNQEVSLVPTRLL